MDDKNSPSASDGELVSTGVRSLRELIEIVSGRSLKEQMPAEDFGLAEALPYPFLALVGQYEMKLALLLTLINPAIGGVLLIGPRGTGKTTAVRGLLDLLPPVERSACFYGCLPEDIESGGMDAVCPDCAQKYARGEPLTRSDRVKLIELPLNAQLEDVVGGIDERAAIHERMRLKRGILAHADLNLLYVDEVNMLERSITDAILDAAASGRYTVRRASISATYRSRFALIGSMNPEEGDLRPQIMDRFGLRVVVEGLLDPAQRLEAYHRTRAYLTNPRQTIAAFSEVTQTALDEIAAAKSLLPKVLLADNVAQAGVKLVQSLKIDTLRAEVTLFEAARAFVAADGRTAVTLDDLQQMAPMALRLRRSDFMAKFIESLAQEDDSIRSQFSQLSGLT
ncbi:MAG: ATP-binding protein [Bellilinea sp.]